MYGLINDKHLEDIVIAVCDCLGNGVNNTAVLLLLETAEVETGKGNIKDTTEKAGMGITQIDKIPFEDIVSRTNIHNSNKLKEHFNIDIDLVQWESLRYNPLLCMIFTRLKYKLIPEIIPKNMLDRALYWKKYYNTQYGKGTIEHYMKMNK